jgi:hypothetical protein
MFDKSELKNTGLSGGEAGERQRRVVTEERVELSISLEETSSPFSIPFPPPGDDED